MPHKSVVEHSDDQKEYLQFLDRIFDNLKSNGIRNGRKDQQAIMYSMEHLDEPYLNAKGYYKDANGKEQCVYFMVGPKFGTVSMQSMRLSRLSGDISTSRVGFAFSASRSMIIST